MGREVRKVPANWEHPKYTEQDAPFDRAIGRHKPLNDGYGKTAKEFMEKANAEGLQAAMEYFGPVDQDEYMPDWPEAERTHLMMYENTSEGTPISPAFATPEELARWLADNNASAFGSSTASYEEWLSAAKRGWSPSAIMENGVMMSGVEALAKTESA